MFRFSRLANKLLLVQVRTAVNTEVTSDKIFQSLMWLVIKILTIEESVGSRVGRKRTSRFVILEAYERWG